MDHLRHPKYKNKQLNNSNLQLKNNVKLINISINDMDKFEKKELTKNNNNKKTFTKNTWYDWCDWLISPKKAGEVNLTPFCFFSKDISSKKSVKPWVFCEV